jgi:hypothetical protein
MAGHLARLTEHVRLTNAANATAYNARIAERLADMAQKAAEELASVAESTSGYERELAVSMAEIAADRAKSYKASAAAYRKAADGAARNLAEWVAAGAGLGG